MNVVRSTCMDWMALPTSAGTAITNKAAVIQHFGDEGLSVGGRTERVEIPEMKLQAHKESEAADRELAIHIAIV